MFAPSDSPVVIGISCPTKIEEVSLSMVKIEGVDRTFVLGGLIDEDIQEVERKVPGLGDIPVFGNLFKSTSKSKVKRNLVVFLKPTIIKNAADMQTISTEKYNYLKAEQMLLEKRGKPVVDLSLIETFLDEQ